MRTLLPSPKSSQSSSPPNLTSVSIVLVNTVTVILNVSPEQVTRSTVISPARKWDAIAGDAMAMTMTTDKSEWRANGLRSMPIQ